MIEHEYRQASDDEAQWSADQIDRQEVTLEFYLEHMTDEAAFIWMDNMDMGLDPWKLTDDPSYFLKEGQRLFVQRKDMRRLGLNPGKPSGWKAAGMWSIDEKKRLDTYTHEHAFKDDAGQDQIAIVEFTVANNAPSRIVRMTSNDEEIAAGSDLFAQIDNFLVDEDMMASVAEQKARRAPSPQA